jgi:hypothetical protein
MTLLLGLPVLVLLLAFVGLPGVEAADRWAASHGLALDDRTRPMVAWHLRTSAILRRLGVQAGLWLPILVSAALDGPDVSGWWWAGGTAGYLVGTIYAELALVRRPVGDGARVALVERREVADYIGPRVLRLQAALGLVLLVGAAAVATVPLREDQGVDRGGALAIAVAGLAVAGGLRVVQGWLVRRPQPYDDAFLVAADDAIRSHSLRIVARAGASLLLLAVAATAANLAMSDVQVLRWTCWILAWAATIGAYVTVFGAERDAWVVRRRALA